MITEDMISNIEYWDKTFNRLMEKRNISDKEKLELADIYNFHRDDIASELCSGTYEWSIPRHVEIRKYGTTKHRVVYIYSAKDRLILGVLYHVFSNYFKDSISKFCYSYKEGCNTSKAIKFIKDYKSYNNQYGVKLDIHAYFNEVSKERLQQMVNELFTSDCGLKQSVEKLLYTDKCIKNGVVVDEYMGLIPGTPLASFFANYCLNECDKHFEEKGSIYARYSDDIILMEETQEELQSGLNVIKDYIYKYGLTINDDKYKYFSPGEDITFLGLKLLADGTIDMSDRAKNRLKKNVHRWCKRSRVLIEKGLSTFEKESVSVNKKLNNKNFKCYIRDEGTFGWCHYMFRYITTDETLKELDAYIKDTLRAMKTGKHNKANYKAVSEDEFRQMGWVSLTQLYHLYKKDFELYCEMISLL